MKEATSEHPAPLHEYIDCDGRGDTTDAPVACSTATSGRRFAKETEPPGQKIQDFGSPPRQ